MRYYYYCTASLLLYLTLVHGYSVKNIQCKLRHALRQCDRNPNKRCATMPNDFRNCSHYRFNHSIYDHASTMVTPPNRHGYIVTTSQYNDDTTPILFSDSTTLSTITDEMNNAWKRGETLARSKRELTQKKAQTKRG